MKAGDTAYLVESNRFVHEVEILRCNGELYIVCFKDNGVGLYFKAYISNGEIYVFCKLLISLSVKKLFKVIISEPCSNPSMF